MKITGVECHLIWVDTVRLNWILTLVRTDAGITGLSQVIMRRHEFTVREAILELNRYLVGKDPLLREEHFEKMYRDGFWLGGALFNTAFSAVDMAMWDIAGKSAGVPIHSLLGGKCRDRIRVYCGAGGRTPDEAVRSVERALKAGYTAIKTGPVGHGDLWGQHQKETEALPLEVIKQGRRNIAAIRKEFGDAIDIAVDAHGRLSPANAIRVARGLEEFDLLFFEESIPPESALSLKLVREATTVPIATGERIFTIYGARDFIENDAIAVLQCDICNTGGFTQYKKIAAMAESHYISIAPHNPNGPLPSIENAQLCAAIPNFLILEHVPEWHYPSWTGELFSHVPQVIDGHLEVPERPGLGAEINEEVLRDLVTRYPPQPSYGTR
jgi:galactonate dehydratase